MKKKSTTIFTLLLASLLISMSFLNYTKASPSLQTTIAERNYIAKQWTYKERGQYETNCLAYALGTQAPKQWYWPWGVGIKPTRGQAKNELYKFGYRNQADAGNLVPLPGNREIYAYYKDGGITHFAVAIGSPANTSAKWGRSEIFGHNTHDPYTENKGGYGHMTFKANLSG